MRNQRIPTLGTLGLAALLAASCGNDDESPQNPLAPSAASTAEAPVDPEYQPGTGAMALNAADVPPGTGAMAFNAADVPPLCRPDPALVARAERFRKLNHRPPNYARNWRQVLVFFGERDDDDLEPLTVAVLREREGRWGGWRPFRVEVERLLACGWTPGGTTTTTTTPVPPEPVSGTVHFVGATASSMPMEITVDEDGVQFQIKRSASNKACIYFTVTWTDHRDVQFDTLDADNCVKESAWSGGLATVKANGDGIDNDFVDGDRKLLVVLSNTPQTRVEGGPLLFTIVNDDLLWATGKVDSTKQRASIYVKGQAWELYSVRATMNGPAWTHPGRHVTRVVTHSDANTDIDLSGTGVDGIFGAPRDCSKGDAWVDFTVFPYPGGTLNGRERAASGIRQEHLKMESGTERHNLC